MGNTCHPFRTSMGLRADFGAKSSLSLSFKEAVSGNSCMHMIWMSWMMYMRGIGICCLLCAYIIELQIYIILAVHFSKCESPMFKVVQLHLLRPPEVKDKSINL